MNTLNASATRSASRWLLSTVAAAAVLLVAAGTAQAGHDDDRFRPRHVRPVFVNPVFSCRPAPPPAPVYRCGPSEFQRGVRAGYTEGYSAGYADAAAGAVFCGTPSVFPPGCDCHFRKGFVRGFNRGYREGFEAGRCRVDHGWSVSWSWSWLR
jgi:hypothetical protein